MRYQNYIRNDASSSDIDIKLLYFISCSSSSSSSAFCKREKFVRSFECQRAKKEKSKRKKKVEKKTPVMFC
jgi:hypothetical protein